MSEPLSPRILSLLSPAEQRKLEAILLRYQKVLRRALRIRDIYDAKHRKNPAAEILSVLSDKKIRYDSIVELSEQALHNYREFLRRKYPA